MKIIAGNSNLELSKKIAKHIGITLAGAKISKFADEEINVEISESVRGEDIFLIQSISYPANDHLMELLVTMDALKRGSAKRITAVIPYFGYARQDRKSTSRSPISAKLVADLITVAGANRVLTVDLHAAQIQGFFNLPVDNILANYLFVHDLLGTVDPDNTVIISPDVGGVLRARSVAKHLNCEIAIIDKRRPKAGVSEVMNIVGDVKGKKCIIVDDIADSAGTLCNAATALHENGAENIKAYVTHGVFSTKALERIEQSHIEEFVCTDTIATKTDVSSTKLRYITIADMLGKAIISVSTETSLSHLFLKG